MAQCHLPSEITTLVMQTDVQNDPPGAGRPGSPPLLQSGLESEAQFETPPAPTLGLGPGPAPNDYLVQTQSQAGSPNAQTPRLESAFISGGFAYPVIGDEEVEPVRNHQKLNKLFFHTAIPFTLVIQTVLFSEAKNTLSVSAWILLKFAAGCNIICLICSFSSIFMCRDSSGLGKRILNLTIYAASAFFYISIMGLLLPDRLKLGFTFLGCVACLPALFMAFE